MNTHRFFGDARRLRGRVQQSGQRRRPQPKLVPKLESLHGLVSCAHPEHDHAGQFRVCFDCGGVNDIENEAIEKSLQSSEQATGFRTARRVVELPGVCAESARQRPASS